MCVRTHTQCIVYERACTRASCMRASIVRCAISSRQEPPHTATFCMESNIRHPFKCKTTAHDARAAVKHKSMPQLVIPMGNGKLN